MKLKLFIFPLSLLVFGAGCTQPEQNTTVVIMQTPTIVPIEEAAKAPADPITQGPIAMPCLQFPKKDGFFRWMDAYRNASDAQAVLMAENVFLPEKADLSMLEALKMTHTTDSETTTICTLQRALNVTSWAVQNPDYVSIYAYYKGASQHLSVPVTSSFTESFYCLPRKMNLQELIWICGDAPSAHWIQVHVNRRSGEMKEIACDTEKDGKTVEPGLGCLK